MQSRRIVNIINFIRGVEPREPIDLEEPVRHQIQLINRYNLLSTFLIQYDAMLNLDILSMLKNNAGDKTEIGLWLEFVQPLVEAVGLQWRSKRGYAWDWAADVGFSVGYTPDERKQLIDECMRKFKECFGFYPRSVGSWTIDALSLSYLSEQYGVVASCNCKDQWGTDGYTLWGGFYMGGYYPSKKNMFCPAAKAEDKIPLPVFRMLGSDPIYQYDLGLNLEGGAAAWQQVATLEPVYQGGGGNPQWVDWFFNQTYNHIGLSHQYTQVGQENSFGWQAMRKGLEYQIEKLSRLFAEGEIVVETLSQSGEWYRLNHEVTAPVASYADQDSDGKNIKSLWYCNKNYRVNLFAEEGRFWIRDLYKFDSRYEEIYLDKTCTSDVLQFDNLPVVDGNRFSGNSIRAGLYPMTEGNPLTFSVFTATENENGVCAHITGENLTFRFSADETGITFESDRSFSLCYTAGTNAEAPSVRLHGNNLLFCHHGFEYMVSLVKGKAHVQDGFFNLSSEENKIILNLSVK